MKSVSSSIVLDPAPSDRRPLTDTLLRLEQVHVQRHPLLQPYGVKLHSAEDKIGLSHRVFRQLGHWHKKKSTSWTTACMTWPPLQALSLTVQDYRCDQTSSVTDRSYGIENKNGVTVGDLFSVVWNTNLTRAMGLIADDGSCMGASYPYTGTTEPCLCYDTLGAQDRSWVKIDEAQVEYEALEGHRFAITDEQKAKQESDGIVRGPVDFEGTEMAS